MNAGVGTAFLAATLTEKILSAPSGESKAIMSKNAAIYQAYSHDFMIPRLWTMNRIWYNMFRDHRLFAAFVICFWACGVENADEQYKDYFDKEDLKWLVGGGRDDFQNYAKEVLAIVAPTDDAKLTEEMVKRVQAISKQCLAYRHSLYPNNKWGRYLRQYNDKLERVPGKRERDKGQKFFSVRCKGCKYWHHNKITTCPICQIRSK